MKADLAWTGALRDPRLCLSWTTTEWERVLRLSRRLRLLGRLAESVRQAGLSDAVPAPVRRHLLAEARYSAWRTTALTWGLNRIGQVLASAGYPCVLLKGGAYIAQDLPIARGRLPSDLDILVPQAHLGDAQARLTAAGWTETAMDEHDQRYYREWSHEVPPMRHPVHPLELDLHHNILPPVARLRVDADRLLARLRPSAWPGWQVLDPADQVLHSAAHLFQDSEARDRLRDLIDLDGLLRHFGSEPGFWSALPKRAVELGLAEPLALALHFTTRWLDTPVPAETQAAVRAAGPGALRRTALAALWAEVLEPAGLDTLPPWRQALAAQVVLVRYHLHRMPLRLLVPHLWHKLRSARGSEPLQ